MSAAARKILLVGSTPDALEAKRVVLERAGYVVGALTKGGSVRRAAEKMEASLVIIDVTSGGPDVRAALVEMSGGTSGKTSDEPPSTIPVLVIGAAEALGEFDGPGTALPKPAEKRALLESTRTLVEGASRKWSRRTRT